MCYESSHYMHFWGCWVAPKGTTSVDYSPPELCTSGPADLSVSGERAPESWQQLPFHFLTLEARSVCSPHAPYISELSVFDKHFQSAFFIISCLL